MASEPSGNEAFFDPYLEELIRRTQFQTEGSIADLELRDQRLQQDLALAEPFMRRRFGQQMTQARGNLAGRGLHGGVVNQQLGDLGEEQAFASGQFEQDFRRGREDIQRQIARLEQEGGIGIAEEGRRAAGRASQDALGRGPSVGPSVSSPPSTSPGQSPSNQERGKRTTKRPSGNFIPM